MNPGCDVAVIAEGGGNMADVEAMRMLEWAEVPQAGCWLKKAGESGHASLMTYRMCL